MCDVAELRVFLRSEIELPANFKLARKEFREGWNVAKRTNAERLEKKIVNRGWNFVKTIGASLSSGIGNTSQVAIASALKLALDAMGEEFNAAEVHRIELTQYPWFFLAKVSVSRFRIQQDAMMSASEKPLSFPVIRSKKSPRTLDSDRLLEFRSQASLMKSRLVVAETRLRRVG